jgi:hypothetical protein
MDEILRKKVSDQQEINSRVSILLAGSALTTTSGVRVQRRETIDEIPYDMLSKKYFHLTNLKNFNQIKEFFSFPEKANNNSIFDQNLDQGSIL